MKKKASVIVETSTGKYLMQEFRPPIPLRSSPRKPKSKLKKEIKRLDERMLNLLTKKQQAKRELHFQTDEQHEKKSLIFVISADQPEPINITEEELTRDKCSLCFVNSSRRSALIFSPRSSRLTLQGLFSVCQVSGPPASLHGHTLALNQRYSIYNISSQSLMSIENSGTLSKISFSTEQLDSFFRLVDLSFNEFPDSSRLIRSSARSHHGLSIFVVEQLRSPWIESMKHFSQNDLVQQWFSPSNEDDANNGLRSLWPEMTIFKDSQFHSIVYSNEIRSTTEKILSSRNTGQPTIVFVCGAKDSGKSTYLRYLINRCLSHGERKIAFLDCDIGQSEFTPSGSISVIDDLREPLFGPSASHLRKPTKSFYLGNIQVTEQHIVRYLNYVRLAFRSIAADRTDFLLVNTMGWGSDNGLMIMKELIDMIRPSSVIQLRSSNAYFRHTMPDIDRQWSLTAPLCSLFRQMHHMPMSSLPDHYEYHLLVTPVRQHNPHGKSHLTRQACLWAYFSQLETRDFRMRALIDYEDRLEIFSFDQLAIGLLHRQIEVKHFLQVLNASIVALCRIPTEMVYRPSRQSLGLIDEHASLECLGFGFVRAIDMTRREIHLIIPDRTLVKSTINALVKGHDDCPEEFYFMSIDRWRGAMPPYVTGSINSSTS